MNPCTAAERYDLNDFLMESYVPCEELSTENGQKRCCFLCGHANPECAEVCHYCGTDLAGDPLIVLARKRDEVQQAIHMIEENQAIAGRGAEKHRDMMAYAKLGVRISRITMGIGCLLAPVAIGTPLLFSGTALNRASKKAV